MAKKRKNTSKNQPQALLSKLLLGLCVLLAVGLLSEKFPQSFEKNKGILEDATSFLKEFKEQPIPEITLPSSKEIIDKVSETKLDKPAVVDPKLVYSDTKSLLHPLLLNEQASEISQHTGFSLSHNEKYKMANYVCYELTREELKGKHTRHNRFAPDPSIEGDDAAATDYVKSGYDRGHMAPAADMTWSKEAMQQSFYYSNICPQAPDFNRGIWKRLEKQTRDWAQRDSAIIVITGPIVQANAKTIGKNKVVIPSHFYKVILSPYVRPMRAIGFLFEHKGSLRSLSYFATPIDSIESLAKIDFFNALPDQTEGALEGTPDLKHWF